MTNPQTEARAIAPERIWIEEDCPYFYEEDELAEAGSPVIEYVRATALAAKDAELAEAKTQLDCALIREGNEKHRAKIAHQNMNAEINARERAEAGERAAHDAANTAIRQRDEARAQLAEARKALGMMLKEHDILSGNFGDVMDPKHKRPDRWPTAAEAARRALEGGKSDE